VDWPADLGCVFWESSTLSHLVWVVLPRHTLVARVLDRFFVGTEMEQELARRRIEAAVHGEVLRMLPDPTV